MVLDADSVEASDLVAFHGDPALKAFYLERLRSHVRQEEIAQGVARLGLLDQGRGDRLHGPQQ